MNHPHNVEVVGIFNILLYYNLCDSKTSLSVPFLEGVGWGNELPYRKETDLLLLNLI